MGEKKAIDDHLQELYDALEVVVLPFLFDLQKCKLISSEELQVVETKPTNEAKLSVLLKLMKSKDHGWEAIINYLRKGQQGTLADKLEIAAGKTAVSTYSTVMPLSLGDFKVDFREKLVNHYKSEYSNVPTMFDCHKHVNEVWVPLRIEERTGNPRQQDTLDHLELLKRMADIHTSSVALVKGHPGVGKTTLVKKIAFDWAIQKIDQFTLILAVPLRYVGQTTDFLQLTTDYYAHRLSLSTAEKLQLLNWLHQLGRKLLICLDGLDEYRESAQSPFKYLFTTTFGRLTTISSCSLFPSLSYQLLVTSRPYACDLMNRDFFPLRFEIFPLDRTPLADFARLYCGTDEGLMKVTEYLEENDDLVIRVPLILTFICYLADVRQEIPSNLTLLYERLLSHMLKREIERDKLQEKIDITNWNNSDLVKSIARLAFEGCKIGQFEFSPEDQSYFLVTNDCFTCGFLLHKFDFREESLNAEFPHRSLQEFFAALFCYQLMLIGSSIYRTSIMKLILDEDSQFGRFLFGICSETGRFEDMLEWLSPTFGDAKTIRFNFSRFLSSISASLVDCLEAEKMGQRLAASVHTLKHQITTDRNQIINLKLQTLSSLNQSFKSGLNLIFLDESTLKWSLSHVENHKCSRLTYILFDPPANLQEDFDDIEIFMWRWGRDLAEMITSFGRIPPVSNLIIQTRSPSVLDSDVDFEVNFSLNYETSVNTTSRLDVRQLRYFTFGFFKCDVPVLKKKFSDQLDIDNFTVTDFKKTGENSEISWLTVTINRSFEQIDLVKALIELALEVPQKSDSFDYEAYFARLKAELKAFAEFRAHQRLSQPPKLKL